MHRTGNTGGYYCTRALLTVQLQPEEYVCLATVKCCIAYPLFLYSGGSALCLAELSIAAGWEVCRSCILCSACGSHGSINALFVFSPGP